MTMACSVDADRPTGAMTREELILSAMPRATLWIRRAIPYWEKTPYADDLLQDACVAIVEAANRYVPERGAWYPYASVAVRNACLDRVTWERGAVHVPRYVYRRAMQTPSERDWLLGRDIARRAGRRRQDYARDSCRWPPCRLGG